MANSIVEISSPDLTPLLREWPVCLGEIKEIQDDGTVLVDFLMNPNEPVEARIIVSAEAQLLSDQENAHVNTTVLLTFEDHRLDQPIIIGVVRDRVSQGHTRVYTNAPVDDVNQHKVVISADEELIVKCGKSSIRLKANGDIILKGNRVLSRAARVNKIKGSTVEIN